jgi:creatinine amidohydrolase
MPLATDTLLGTTTACGVAAALGNALVAPTIRPGFSPHHMDFPGTLTLRQSTLTAIIVDYCTSLVAHGFTTLVVISSHGGNTSIVKMAAQEAQTAVGEKALVVPITDVVGYFRPDYDRRREGYHATYLEASRILAIAPDLMRMERAQDWQNPIPPELKDVGALLGLRPVKFFAPDGTMGMPTGANVELGRESIDYICHNIAAQVRLVVNSAQGRSA